MIAVMENCYETQKQNIKTKLDEDWNALRMDQIHDLPSKRFYYGNSNVNSC